MTNLQAQRLEQEIKTLKADIIILKRLFTMASIERVKVSQLTKREQKWVRKTLKDIRTRSKKDWLTLKELKEGFQK